MDPRADMHMCAKIGASRPSRLFPEKFRDGRTYAYTYTMPYCVAPFNSVGTV